MVDFEHSEKLKNKLYAESAICALCGIKPIASNIKVMAKYAFKGVNYEFKEVGDFTYEEERQCRRGGNVNRVESVSLNGKYVRNKENQIIGFHNTWGYFYYSAGVYDSGDPCLFTGYEERKEDLGGSYLEPYFILCSVCDDDNIRPCSICNEEKLFSNKHNCSECNRTFCVDCFDSDFGMCKFCKKKVKLMAPKAQQQSQQVIVQAPAAAPAADVSKIQKILDGLDERLALGEISEETYNNLSKKWQDKL